MLILVDSREQLPYWKRGDCAKTALCVGDYTTASLLNHFHIERKSLIDLYGTLTRGHARFRREIMRAKEKRIHLCIVVEGTRSQFIDKDFPRGRILKIDSGHLRKIVKTMIHRYDLDIIWCKGRVSAKREVEKILMKEEKKFNRKIKIR